MLMSPNTTGVVINALREATSQSIFNLMGFPLIKAKAF